MVASGLPTVYERHAQEMSLLALELLDSVKHHVIDHLPHEKMQLRIGLHSGSSNRYGYMPVHSGHALWIIISAVQQNKIK